MNKITPSRIAIFSSEVMMKKKSIVVSYAAEVSLGFRLLDSSTHRHELRRDPILSEHCGVQPGSRWLVRLLLRRWDASAAILQCPESARRDRRFCLDSIRRIVGLFRSSGGKHLQSNEANRRRRLLEEGRVKSPNHRAHCPAGESLRSTVVSGLCR